MEQTYDGGNVDILEVIISPYSSKVADGKTNAKNYPYWPELVALLNRDGYKVIQIGVTGEERITGVSEFLVDLSYGQLADLGHQCATWIAVDNFWPHFCHASKLRRGIVLWGVSDPKIWGYPENVNLLRGRDFLRQHQFQTWNEIDYNPNAFIFAENVLPHVYKFAPATLRRLALV